MISVSLTLLELQFDTTERGPSGREAYENNHSSRKSDDTVLTGQSDDRLLLCSNIRSCWRLHCQDLLAVFPYDFASINRLSDHFWSCKRYGRGQDRL
jgi:hypothetical protein